MRHSLDILEGFNVDDKTWMTLAKLRVPRSGLGGAFLKVRVVIYIGKQGKYVLYSLRVRQLYISNQRWLQRVEMCCRYP